MQKIYTIYRAINLLNGKSYIGFDSQWPLRMKQHIRNVEYDSNLFVFKKALRKHGLDNFEWEVIYQSLDRDHTLDIMEPYFIEYYRTYIGWADCKGYNATLGGSGVSGRLVSDSEIKSRDYVYRRNEKTFTVMSPDGTLVTHRGVARFCKIHNLPSPGGIRDLLRGGKKSYLGWTLPMSREDQLRIQKRSSKIQLGSTATVISPDGEIYQVYGSAKFCREHDLSVPAFRAMLRGKSKTSAGWRLHVEDK